MGLFPGFPKISDYTIKIEGKPYVYPTDKFKKENSKFQKEKYELFEGKLWGMDFALINDDGEKTYHNKLHLEDRLINKKSILRDNKISEIVEKNEN